MKKLLLFFVGILLSISMYSQSGADCYTAIPFSNTNSCITNNTQSFSSLWYSFVADHITQKIQLTLNPISTGHIHTMELIGGVCNTGLSKIDSVSITLTNDTLLTLNEISLVVGNTYYIRARNDDPSCPQCKLLANYGICLSPLIGDVSIGVSTIGTGFTSSCGTTGCNLITICANTPINLGTSVGATGYIWTALWTTAPGAMDITLGGVPPSGVPLPGSGVPLL